MNKESLQKIKELQEEKKDIDQKIKNIKEKAEKEISKFKKDYNYNQLIDNIDILANGIEEEAKKEFKETGKKKLLGGIGIQQRTTTEYDEEKAFNWAKEHNLCLKLDKKAFEKIAKNQYINFVTKNKEEKVTWPKEIKLED